MTADELSRQLGLSTFMSGGDLKVIASMITDGEKLGIGSSVKYDRGGGHLVATDSRLIYASKFMLSTKTEVFYYNKINHIEYKGGLLTGAIKLTIGRKVYEFDNLTKDIAKRLVNYVNEQINNPAPKKQADSGTKENAKSGDSYAELEKLAKLKEQGIITEEEFTQKKKQILGI
jgi:hypothetical protein